MKYDLGLLKKLAGEDKRFIIDMLLTFKRTSTPIIERMIQYVSVKKYEALGREAHKLIPGVSFLGATDLKNELIKIEEGVKNKDDLQNMHTYVMNVKQYIEELIVLFEKDFDLQ